jgi:hypothetical protein
MESNDDTAVGLRMSSRQKKPSRRILEGDDNEKIPKKISHCLLENDYWYESSSQSPKKRALQDGARASSKRPRTAVTDSAAALSTTEQPIADLHQDAILALTEMSKLTPVNCEEEANDSKSATAPTTTKNWWSAAEDEKLRQLIAKEDKIAKMEHGDVRWTNVAKALGGGRTSKQCRERFANHLRSNLVKGNWSASEDQLLFQLQSIHGNSWATIRKHMPHRAENDIKNRWYSDQRAKKRALRRGEGEEEGPKKQKKKQTKQTKPVASVSKVAAAETRKSLPEEPVGHAASLNVSSRTNDAPTEAIVEEKPSQILWAPSGRQGAVVLSTLDGTPLVLLEGVQTDASELFRTGAIQATSLFGTQHAKQRTTTVNADASTTQTPTPTKLLPPAHKYSRWTDEEDDVLRKAVDNQGTPPIDWLQISRNYFRGMRTAQQCKNRWKKVRRAVSCRSSRLFVVGILLTISHPVIHLATTVPHAWTSSCALDRGRKCYHHAWHEGRLEVD